MARHPKIEVSAINIRIPEEFDRNYNQLISFIAALKVGVKVHGNNYIALSFYDDEEQVGVLSKYTEMDIDGDWFDLEDFDSADPDKISEIKIPENLRPNLAQFFFKLDPELHIIAFSSYSESKAVSARSVHNFFSEILSREDVKERFGKVEADVIKSYEKVDRILALDDLKELRLIVRRPNTDDMSESLAEVIERRLQENSGDEYEEVYRDKSGGGLTPSDRTREIAQVAAENGQVLAKSLINGVLTPLDTSNTPLTEVTTYDPEDGELPIFFGVADKIFAKVREARERIRR